MRKAAVEMTTSLFFLRGAKAGAEMTTSLLRGAKAKVEMTTSFKGFPDEGRDGVTEWIERET